MKIGPLDSKTPVAPASAERKGVNNGHGSQAAAAQPEPSAKVELSAAASLLARAEADGGFDAQKVERLAAAIRDGSFRVDAEAIADKLIANAHDMLLGRSSK